MQCLAEPLSVKPCGLHVGEVSAMYEREGKIYAKLTPHIAYLPAPHTTFDVSRE